MAAVCIQVINPNTSLAMTESIGAAARAVAAMGYSSLPSLLSLPITGSSSGSSSVSSTR